MYPKNGYVLYEHGLAQVQLSKPAEGSRLRAAEEVNKTFRPAETWVYPTAATSSFRRTFDSGRAWRSASPAKHDEAVAILESLFPKIESLAGSTTAIEPPPGAVALEGHIDHSYRAAFYEDALALEAKGDKARALDVIKRYQKLRMNDEALNQKVKELQKRLK
jgi:hypothetical protein